MTGDALRPVTVIVPRRSNSSCVKRETMMLQRLRLPMKMASLPLNPREATASNPPHRLLRGNSSSRVYASTSDGSHKS